MTLRQLRETRGWTQEDLEAKSGLKQTHISAIENGKIRSPQYDTVKALARALDIKPEDVAAALAETISAVA